MKIKSLAGIVMVMLVSCSTISLFPACRMIEGVKDEWCEKLEDMADLGDAQKMYEKAVAAFVGDPKEKDNEGWTMGPQKIPVHGQPENWRFQFRTKDIDMTRPGSGKGKPERIVLSFKFSNGKGHLYFMPGGRDGVRLRLKGGTDYNLHVGNYIVAPIPKHEAHWEVTVTGGMFDISLDGTPLRTRKKYLPCPVPGAKLKGLYWSPDGGRPAGCPVKLGEVEKLP